MIGVCIGTAALIIVLSVFNGLEDLNREIFKSSDPDLKITASVGKSFDLDSLKLTKIKAINGIKSITQVIEDNALAKQGDDQIIVHLKGVDSTFQQTTKLGEALVDGIASTEINGLPYAFVGGGVYTRLNLQTQNFLDPLELWYPKNQKLNVLNPEDNITRASLPVSGVFALEQQFDDYVFIPIGQMQNLTGLKNKLTAYEIFINQNDNPDNIKLALGNILGKKFTIRDRDEQNEALFRAIRIEKLFIFVALLFIIGVASFNIFFSLSMLVLDKKDDISTLAALGANKNLIQKIFFTEGAFIGILGSTIGMLVGITVCLSQMYFGWLKMGMEFAIIDAYPVQLKFNDIIYSSIGILLITVLASFFPARKAISFM